jgi:nucleoside-diphosphate-sugar epimerase
MGADAVMVNVAWAAALLARLGFEIVLHKDGVPHRGLVEYVDIFLATYWILTIISLIAFSASGFYSHGRYYQGKYKALVVGQAVSVSYLAFGFVAFFFGIAAGMPRGAWFAGWILTCAFLITARLWSMLWKGFVTGETEKRQPPVRTQNVKKILVIGGAGYIGSALLPKLLDRGYHVRLLDLFLFGREPIANLLGHPNLEIIEADFRHMDKIVRAVRGMDDVIHLGAIVGDPACSLDQELTVEVNLIATRMIAEVAKGSGIRRFCFASTCSVYGASDHILDERSQLNPISLYARSKLASENVLRQMADSSFHPVILRFGTVYGQSGRTRFDLIINLLTAKALVEGKITVCGGGQWRPFVHVDDAAAALAKVIKVPTEFVDGEVFNVGSNEQNYQLMEAAQVIQSLVPKAEIVELGANTDFRNYRVDFTRITRAFGFIPRWTLKDGIQQVIAALEKGEVRDYRDPIYSNVKFLGDESSRLIRSEMSWAARLLNEEAGSSSTVGAVGALSER